jgi:hypothetical protein
MLTKSPELHYVFIRNSLITFNIKDLLVKDVLEQVKGLRVMYVQGRMRVQIFHCGLHLMLDMQDLTKGLHQCQRVNLLQLVCVAWEKQLDHQRASPHWNKSSQEINMWYCKLQDHLEYDIINEQSFNFHNSFHRQKLLKVHII